MAFDKEAMKKRFGEIIRFGMVGVASSCLFYLLYLILTALTKPIIAYYASYGIAMVFSVVSNLFFTFKSKLSVARLSLFFVVYLTSMYVGGQILSALISHSMGPRLAGLLAVGVVIVLNFVGMRLASSRVGREN